ncbi:MAG: hypothetical protein PF501_18940 [Salinisphaera sp.]|jgi:hypothetical protein|nr:hypothetical protein [Salinisphaera sp.]
MSAIDPKTEQDVDGCCVTAFGQLAYVWPRTWGAFDAIPLEKRIGNWENDPASTICKDDGREWQKRCHSKTLGNFAAGSVTVIFQWFEPRIAPTDKEA